jgi:hypothetical protein
VRSTRLFGMTVAGGIIAATASFLSPPAFAADYTASGTIQRATPTDVSVTNLQFQHSGCDTALSTQGLDAYVFEIPAAYAVDGTTVSLTAPSTAPRDLHAYVYNSDCSFDRKVATAATFDLTTRLAPDDTYLVVFSETGANIAVSLTATLPTTTTYYDEGAMLRNASTGVSVTDTDFSLECTSPPATQGTDAWVFPVPASAAGSTVSIASVPLGALHDFQASVYDSSCGFLRLLDDTSSFDLSFTAGAADAYVVVWSTTGANLWAELSV